MISEKKRESVVITWEVTLKVHPKLERFGSFKNIKKFSKLLRFIENDLKTAGVVEFEVDMWEKARPASAIRRMLTLEDGTEAHQIMFISGNFQGRSFIVAIPLRNSRTMPYSVEIELPVGVGFVANFLPALVGGKWKVVEGPEGVKDHLKSFAMPKIAWSHSAGGYNYRIFTGSTISPLEGSPDRTLWSIQSGFQGNIIRRDPKCAQFLLATQDLESTLSAR